MKTCLDKCYASQSDLTEAANCINTALITTNVNHTTN